MDVLLGVATVAGIYRGDVRGFGDGAVDGCVRVWVCGLLGLGMRGVLLLLLWVCSTIPSHASADTHTYPINSYTFTHSLADAVALALGRGLLTALVGAVVLCLHYAGRGGEGAGKVRA